MAGTLSDFWGVCSSSQLTATAAMLFFLVKNVYLLASGIS